MKNTKANNETSNKTTTIEKVAKTPDNITALRDYQMGLIMKLERGEIDPRAAREINNASRNAIASVSLQMQYAQMIGKDQAIIPFLK